MLIAIEGFPADVTDADIRQALEEFGCTIQEIKIHESKPGAERLAVVDVDTDDAGGKALAKSLNGYVWRGRTLQADTFLFGNK